MYIKNLSLTFGTQTIFDNVNCVISENEKIGIVGVNGAGKSTFFNLLLKNIEPDKGSIILKKGTTVALLPQVIEDFKDDSSVFEYLLSARPIDKLKEKLSKLYEEVSMTNDERMQNKILKEIGYVQSELDYYDIYEAESILLKIIDGMHIDSLVLDMKLKNLSGGQKSKIAFARLLYSKAEIILLDEPTNHLDSDTKNYIINYLKNYHGNVLIISHDTDFLDMVTTKTLYLDKVTHNMTLYDGNYSKFLRVKKENDLALETKSLQQQKEIDRLEKIVLHYSNSSGKRKKMAQDREKKLDKLKDEAIVLESKYKSVKFEIKIDNESSSNPIIVNNLFFSYDAKNYIINNLSFSLNKGEKFLILGFNGVGKSTLLKLIMGINKPNSGKIIINYKTKIAYYAQEHESLSNDDSILDNFKDLDYTEKEIRNCLGRFLFHGDDIYKKISVLSPGERARVILAKISLSGANVLILDEPTNHLDPETQAIICEIFKEYKGTMLIVSHNKEFVKNLGIERVLLLPSGKIQFFDDKMLNKYEQEKS